ncbi:MAG: cytochrome P450 [Granulosicoccus sp.]
MYRTQLIVPPDKPLGTLTGIRTAIRNPVEWWPACLYENGVHAITRLGTTHLHVALPELIKPILFDKHGAYGRSNIGQCLLQPAMGDSLLTSYGEHWRQQRKIAAPVFRQTTLHSFIPAIDKAAIGACDQLAIHEGRTVPVLPTFVDTTLEVIIQTMFGNVSIDRESIKRDTGRYIQFMGQISLLDLFGVDQRVPRLSKLGGTFAVRRLRAMCHRVLNEHREFNHLHGSLTERLSTAVDPDTGEGLSDDSIVDNIMAFIGAGHETTSVALCWTLYLLAAQPQLQQAVQEHVMKVVGDGPITTDQIDELQLLERVFQESMRLYPPIPSIGRSVKTRTQVGDFTLNAGDQIVVAIMPLHRNPHVWPDPHRFDADRFQKSETEKRDRFAFLPFGGGPRVCISAQFATMEAMVVLARLLSRYEFSLPKDQEPKPESRISLRPHNDMPLYISRR